MKFLLNTRQKMGCKRLRNKAEKVQRQKSYHNIDSAESIGLLFDSTVQANYFSARRFITGLVEAGKNVEALGMVLNEEMLRYYTPSPNIHLFSLEKITFFGYPDNREVEDFIKKDFDILINICTTENLSVDYVMGMSRAKFKVSVKFKENDFADFALEFKDDRVPETDELINRIKQYLTAISRK
ncbi:MAG: hypothetical protein II165_08435 [Bacteroidales bacterium]|nr:hypothetical protein [Bacteroidales bacterium]